MSQLKSKLAKAKNLGVLRNTLEFNDSLNFKNRQDLYRFSLRASDTVSLVLKQLQANVDLELIDKSGQQIAISKRGARRNEKIKANLDSGTYYVRIFHESGQTSYRLKILGSGSEVTSLSAEEQQILDTHNRYRREVGVPLLTWSNELEDAARKWANHLAALGGNTLEHDSNSGDQGENLWAGSAGAFTVIDAVNLWGSEKRFFRLGTFPDVSTTGDWTDVGHYTQMIWRKTLHLGCSRVTVGGNDILVCRYSPSGNYIGQPVL